MPALQGSKGAALEKSLGIEDKEKMCHLAPNLWLGARRKRFEKSLYRSLRRAQCSDLEGRSRSFCAALANQDGAISCNAGKEDENVTERAVRSRRLFHFQLEVFNRAEQAILAVDFRFPSEYLLCFRNIRLSHPRIILRKFLEDNFAPRSR
jgi:hypothetical protein